MTTLNDLEALAKAATPGPWESHPTGVEVSPFGDTRAVTMMHGDKVYELHHSMLDDAKYIAAASPQTILQMIALIRQIGDALEVASDLTMPYDDCECSVCKAVDAWKEFKRGH